MYLSILSSELTQHGQSSCHMGQNNPGSLRIYSVPISIRRTCFSPRTQPYGGRSVAFPMSSGLRRNSSQRTRRPPWPNRYSSGCSSRRGRKRVSVAEQSTPAYDRLIPELRDEPGPTVARSVLDAPDRRDGRVYVCDAKLKLAVEVALATGRPLLLRG